MSCPMEALQHAICCYVRRYILDKDEMYCDEYCNKKKSSTTLAIGYPNEFKLLKKIAAE